MPFDFLAQTPEFISFSDINTKSIHSVKPLDWKEEHIKAKIIRNNKLPYNYFDGIERNFNRRIRIFLYLAGFWDSTGDKEKLDKYITLAIEFGLKYDTEPPLELVKLFYLFATGFDGSSPIQERPLLEQSLFYWEDDSKIGSSKLEVLALTFDYLCNKNIHSTESLNEMLRKTAYDFYNKKDWRAFALVRDENILFNHLENEMLKTGNESKVIFPLVKQLDLKGKSFNKEINYKEDSESFGEIGKNIYSNKTITLKNEVSGRIVVELPESEKYLFYTEKNYIFTIYKYSNFDGESHQFKTQSFEISQVVNEYASLTKDIKQVIQQIPPEKKNEILTNVIYWETKQLEEVCKEHIKLENCKIGHWYNHVIFSFEKELTIPQDLDTTKSTARLGLYNSE
jgi:hypothetical protein